GSSLIGLHMALCLGAELGDIVLPEVEARAGAHAAAILYAPHELRIPPGWIWPAWTADRPAPGFFVRNGEAICTIYGDEASTALARRSSEARAGEILAELRTGRYAAATGTEVS